MDILNKALDLADQAGSKISEAAEAVVELARDHAGDFVQTASDVALDLKDKVEDLADAAGDKLVDVKDAVVDAGTRVAARAMDGLAKGSTRP